MITIVFIHNRCQYKILASNLIFDKKLKWKWIKGCKTFKNNNYNLCHVKMLDIKEKYKLTSIFLCNRKMKIVWHNGVAALIKQQLSKDQFLKWIAIECGVCNIKIYFSSLWLVLVLLRGFVIISPCLPQPQPGTRALSLSEPTHVSVWELSLERKMRAATGFLPNAWEQGWQCL